MKFTDDTLNAIKTHSRLPEVLAELIPDLKRNGQGYKARVPWREDGKPSLRLELKNGAWLYVDEANGDGGDGIGLVERVGGMNFPAAVRWLADRLGIVLPVSDRGPVNHKPNLPAPETHAKALARLYALAKPLNDGLAGTEYLRGRGLLEAARALAVRCFEPGEPREIIGKGTEYGLSTPERWTRDGYGYLVYPATVNGQTFAHRTRLLMSQGEAAKAGFKAAHWTPSTEGGLEVPATWPGLPDTLPAEIVLTEGETDALAVRTLMPGCECFALLGAGRFGPSDHGFQRIVKARPKIILAFQRDSASARGAKRIIGDFKRYGLDVRALVPAGGLKDWADVLQERDGEPANLDDIGCPLGDYSIGQTFDALGRHLSDRDCGKLKVIPVPWSTLEWCFNDRGIPPKTVGLLSSKTGTGKTWMTMALAMFVAGFNEKKSLPVFVLNSEMDEGATACRLLALAGKDAELLDMNKTSLIRERRAEFQADIDRLPMEITPPEPRSLEDALAILTEKARTHKLLIVDHIGDLSYSGKSWETLPDFTRKVRDIARRTGTVILMVTHLKQTDAGFDTLAYSKAIETIVDWSFSLQAFDPTPAVIATSCGNAEDTINRTLTIRKNRFGRSDIRIAMHFNDKTLALSDLGRLVKILKQRQE